MENNSEYGGMSEAPATTFNYKTVEPAAQPQRWTLKLGKDGRLVIPAAARAAMDIGSEGQVTAVLEDGTLKLFSPATAWRKIDEIMKPYRDPSRSMVDELLAERRAEAAAEDAKD